MIEILLIMVMIITIFFVMIKRNNDIEEFLKSRRLNPTIISVKIVDGTLTCHTYCNGAVDVIEPKNNEIQLQGFNIVVLE